MTRISSILHEDQCRVLSVSRWILLRMRNVSEKQVSKKSKHTINFLFFLENIWENTVMLKLFLSLSVYFSFFFISFFSSVFLPSFSFCLPSDNEECLRLFISRPNVSPCDGCRSTLQNEVVVFWVMTPCSFVSGKKYFKEVFWCVEDRGRRFLRNIF